MKFKVIPIHSEHRYRAPYLLVEVPKESGTPYEDAIEAAKKRSRLSDFPVWTFLPIAI